MTLKYQCSPQQRMEEVIDVLSELHLNWEQLEENYIKVHGKYAVFAEFLPSSHVALFKYNHKWNRNTNKWTCEGMEAITLYLKQHAL